MPCRRGSRSRAVLTALSLLQPMTDTTPLTSGRTSRLTGYLLALAAGATWGTTGPSRPGCTGSCPHEHRILAGAARYRLPSALGTHLPSRAVPRRSRRLAARGLGGGCLVALFEVAYQYAIAGAGVAGAAAMLYTAPVIVAVLARLVLKEALTPVRLVLALLVMAASRSRSPAGATAAPKRPKLGIGRASREACSPPSATP